MTFNCVSMQSLRITSAGAEGLLFFVTMRKHKRLIINKETQPTQYTAGRRPVYAQ